jgi:hypothetical protein
MRTFTVFAMPAVALAIGACTQTAGTPAPVTAGPMDPNSVTVFTLAVQPGSVTGCMLGDSSMTRPVKLIVMNNKAELLTDGGVHYGLDRIGPGRYAGGNYIKIAADLTTSPKRLAVSSNDGACKWGATTP